MQETQLNITEDAVARIAQTGGEPEWVQSLRKKAWNQFQSMDPPPQNHEEWRRLNVPDFRFQDLTLPFHQNGSGGNGMPKEIEIISNRPGGEDPYGGTIVQLNGKTVENVRKKLPNGVLFEPIQEAFRTHGDLLFPYLTKEGLASDRDKLTALHFSLFHHGVFLYVPEDTEVELPLRFVNAIQGSNSLHLPHVVAVLQKGSKVNFVYDMTAERDVGPVYNYGMVQFFLEERSQMGYLSLHNFGDQVVDRTIQKGILSRESRLNWTAYLGGTKTSKWNFEADLLGEYADVAVNGAYKIKKKEAIDVYSHVRHRVPNTHGHVLVNGSANDSSKAMVQGLIEIAKGAQKTVTYLENHNLLLGKKCLVDSIPRLEILADDVKASHGVTLTDIDDEHLFYMMSRGVEKKEARRLIVDGFFRDILRRAETDLFQRILADALGMEVDDE
jgi:Fe-S cluster assembly protein SufD